MNPESILDFKKYVEKEIRPAAAELEDLDDSRRKHLQKLVYTNLVNRFDAMVDIAILDNATEESLIKRATKNMDGNVTEAALVELLLQGTNLQDALVAKLCGALRYTLLKERHSKKLSALFEAIQSDVQVWNHPRVNVSTGRISVKIKPQNRTTPYSICGYADWLYSRRNALVHGTGSSTFLKNDITQLKKLFKCTPAKRIIIKLAAIKTAAAFYDDVSEMLLAEVT